MKHTILAAIAAISLGTSAAVAQAPTPANPSSAAGAKLSQSECTNIWQQANPSGVAGLTQAQAAPYVSDFKAVNTDGDMTLNQNEWMAACNKGMVKSTSGSGSSTGASGSSGSSTGSGSSGSSGSSTGSPGSN